MNWLAYSKSDQIIRNLGRLGVNNLWAYSETPIIVRFITFSAIGCRHKDKAGHIKLENPWERETNWQQYIRRNHHFLFSANKNWIVRMGHL